MEQIHGPSEVCHKPAAPAWTPRCRELSCCLSLRKEPPGKPLGSGIFRHSMLFLVARFPVLGWNGLEGAPVSSVSLLIGLSEKCPTLCLAF